ncbi:winged helix-turn-helix transcriptional regulator [Paenibacillus sp.]|uniref:winged helix-turn-helix transcriptional regulator n=1 Tax=Paenibacillus sp. TaxID=58172 RepID=UPI002D61E11C|nr:winged helix-turn-helix transcriptional regulator [Paenibacillus sp.]HZG83450.1 winged helix-turn-helix transcriptional regulator [Paenibacillus sp.]
MDPICPRFEKSMQIIGKRWSGLIVHQLMQGPQRFCRIEAALPNLSGRVLSERLKELEQEGIIRRSVYPETPVRIEYSLTDKGLALAPVFREVQKWASEWVEAPAAAEEPDYAP